MIYPASARRVVRYGFSGQNPASDINLVHPFIKDSADLQSGNPALRDRRFLAKVTDRPDTFSLNCLASALSWVRYPTPNSPIPIIRNEELFLLRAEANWFAATGSKAQAVIDLNFVLQNSGGLAPGAVTPLSTDAQFVNALLHERLYCPKRLSAGSTCGATAG